MRVQTRPRIRQVETLSDYFSHDLSSLGHTSNRSVCLPPQQSVTNLSQLEKGSICIENRCIPTGLAREPPLRLPIFRPLRESPKGKTVTVRNNPHYAILAEPDLVQHSPCNDSSKSDKIKITQMIPLNYNKLKYDTYTMDPR